MKKKSITRNYIYNVLYQVLVIIVPLITTPYLSRVLGAEGIGIYSYTYAIVTYFILFSLYSLYSNELTGRMYFAFLNLFYTHNYTTLLCKLQVYLHNYINIFTLV